MSREALASLDKMNNMYTYYLKVENFEIIFLI